MTEPFSKLFGSAARVKILRLFLYNPKISFTIPEAATRAHTSQREARREVSVFLSMKLLKAARRNPRALGRRFILSEEFPYREALQNLLFNAEARGQIIVERIRRIGAVKLVVLSGIFVGDWEGRLDLLIVGDRINERRLSNRIRTLESQLGRELRYALLTSADFLYRLNMNDHLVRDVMDYSHRIVLDKLDIGLK